jgi:hypothetical protein
MQPDPNAYTPAIEDAPSLMTEPPSDRASLRAQVRQRLADAVAYTRHVLTTYPDPAPGDGAPYLGEAQPTRAYLESLPQQEGVEAVPFGSLADPVSQAAFALAPHVQPYARGVAEMFAGAPRSAVRLPGTGGLLAERGNLGPPPVGPRGEPLPESVVRAETGELEQLYHGTPRRFPDFDVGRADPQGKYGPGIYMTNSAAVASGYAQTRTLSPTARGAVPVRMFTNPATAREDAEAFAAALQAAAPDSQVSVSVSPRGYGVMQRVTPSPNVRPVYADLQNPFDIEGTAEASLIRALRQDFGSRPLGHNAHTPTTGMPNSTIYRVLEQELGDRAAANQWLQENGYDGITHIGGANTGTAPHRVYIAFSPDNVYPSFNVDALPGAPR